MKKRNVVNNMGDDNKHIEEETLSKFEYKAKDMDRTVIWMAWIVPK